MNTSIRMLALLLILPGLAFGKAVVIPVPAASDAFASVDLATKDGAAVVGAQWRYHQAEVVDATFRAAGPDGQPGTQAVATMDVSPFAGAAQFDDSSWPVIAADSLSSRRGDGRLSFNWYRVQVTVPEMIAGQATTGSTLVMETSLDDYAEIWVDGELPRAAGQSGGSVIAGWNASNRLVIGRGVHPGQQIQIAIFGANGPLSRPPTNYVYIRDAKLEFHNADVALPFAVPPQEVNVEVIRHDPAIDAIVPANPKAFKLAEGFQFTEGPVWVGGEDGHLLFSDPNANRIYRYSDSDGLSVFREKSGYHGADIAEYRQPGSNGITFDRQGRLTFDQHGERRVVRLEEDGKLTVLADRYQGKRFNSPNDLVYKSDGSVYFTDPFFGLPKFAADPRKELPSQGVYRAKDGEVTLLTDELQGPNGIAFSPDEQFLYVGDWNDQHKAVVRYPVKADGTIGAGQLFYDLTSIPGEDAIDGIKVDQAGNVFVSGPGGLSIFGPSGKLLGTVVLPRHPHNFAWGGADGMTLYLTSQDRLYRMRFSTTGVRPIAGTN